MGGLRVGVYKHGGFDFSNGGASSRFQELVLVNVGGPSSVEEGNAAMLVEGNLAGTLKVVEAEWMEGGMNGGDWVEKKGDGVGPMFGGCYVGTSDSRFEEACQYLLGHKFYGLVALHDRYETVEQYASYD